VTALTFTHDRTSDRYTAFQPDGTRVGYVHKSRRRKQTQEPWEARIRQPLTEITRTAGCAATPDEAKRLLVHSFSFHHCNGE